MTVRNQKIMDTTAIIKDNLAGEAYCAQWGKNVSKRACTLLLCNRFFKISCESEMTWKQECPSRNYFTSLCALAWLAEALPNDAFLMI